MPTAQSAKADWKLRIELLIVAAVAAIAIAAILALTPVQHSYSEQFSSAYSTPGAATLTVPRGSQVSGSWATGDGRTVDFGILDSNQNLIYTSDASNGTYSFTASSPPYTFVATSFASEPVYVWGTYSAPLI
jgi:hypothetical protein